MIDSGRNSLLAKKITVETVPAYCYNSFIKLCGNENSGSRVRRNAESIGYNIGIPGSPGIPGRPGEKGSKGDQGDRGFNGLTGEKGNSVFKNSIKLKPFL